MDVRFVITFMMMLSIILTTPHFSFAEEKDSDEDHVIESFHIDITGDGIDEAINLKGILFSDDSMYYRQIWMEITNDKQEEWKVQLGSGYEPSLQFIDINHDGIKNILYQSATGGSGGLYHYELHSFANSSHELLELPAQPHVTGHFLDDFQVTIEIAPMTKPIVMDVSKRKDAYISSGIYDTDGKLLTPTNLMIDPIAFYEPMLLSASKGYGLKSYQQISGAYHADRLGTIETIWYFENGKWMVLKTDWVPTDDST